MLITTIAHPRDVAPALQSYAHTMQCDAFKTHANKTDDAPLKLSELRNRLDAGTYAWLEKHDEISNDCTPEEDEARAASRLLFEARDDDEEVRVLRWSSSKQNSDGFGGYDCYANENETKDDEIVTVKYILSTSSGGHGDDIWAASRHLSNLLADSIKCSTLIQTPQSDSHPLLGKKLLELGAGGGIPSMTAYKRGATVVCTDQAIPDRIRCLAEAAERNYRDAGKAESIRVFPYSWGDNFLLDDGKQTFDVIVAADCVYYPRVHNVLLQSIHMLMADDGVALLPFALHGNTDDDNVWGIVDTAKAMGFVVEQLESAQLSPQIKTMDPKRGLVHMLRLTRGKR